MIIAIDGPAGSGKSTTAKKVAAAKNWLYIDTGAMYRAIGYGLQQLNDLTEERAIQEVPNWQVDLQVNDGILSVFLNQEDISQAIRTPEAGQNASKVARWAVVRNFLTAQQRNIAQKEIDKGKGVVLDGRDIGTVVFPQADLKIFLVADVAERAKRRHAELQAKGIVVDFEVLLQEIAHRDFQDQNREIAPLKKAADAIELDSTKLSITEQVAKVLDALSMRR
jgi:CMP/dCMP kinase